MKISNNKQSSLHPAIYLIAFVVILFSGFNAYATNSTEQAQEVVNTKAKSKNMAKDKVEDPKPAGGGYCCVDPPSEELL